MSSIVYNATPPSRRIELYHAVAANDMKQLQILARPLVGHTIWHINSATQGGGVAELLRSQVALEQGLGLNSIWLVIRPADPHFFVVTKKIHNGLQGDTTPPTRTEWKLYAAESQRFAQALEEQGRLNPANLIIAHDPQPLAAVRDLSAAVSSVLRIHPDICHPSPWALDWLCAQVPHFDRTIVSRQDCRPTCLINPATIVIAPAIDPLAEKNVRLPRPMCQAVLAAHNINPQRPLIAQVSRFDKWKDQLGVLAAYQQAKLEIPELQLALVGFLNVEDDPEAAAYYENVRQTAAADPDVHLFSELKQLHDISQDTFVNAIQTASDIIIQKSIREGFGLTVAEAMWKSTPVIGSFAGGIALQIQHEHNGVLVQSIEETAKAITRLLKNPEERRRLGTIGHVSVHERFLLPRYLVQHLSLYTTLQKGTQ
ncbi:MAG: glycosyltransferase [Candidatus Andersenbacteria bacterium]